MFKLCKIFFILLFTTLSYSQITSSSINGKITLNGDDFFNCEVVLKFNPTNSEYKTITNKHGFFGLDNLDVGGPYTIYLIKDDKVLFFKKNLYLLLGDNDLPTIRL